MALTKIITQATLGTWLQTSINDFNYCYLVAKKETPTKTDTLDVEKVKSMVIELGIDSGVENHPITIKRVTLSFKDALYRDEQLDNRVTYALLNNIPSSFYIKVLSVNDGDKDYFEGKVSISVATNGLKLL